MATLIHLNGAPGVGKSTIAERYLADHPGVLSCDVDRLRCLVGGWADDFGAVGAVVRPLALAMIRTHLDGGRDVVLPQMLADEDERARFRTAAVGSGHGYVPILLQAPPGGASARFYARAPDDALHAVIRGVVDGDGWGIGDRRPGPPPGSDRGDDGCDPRGRGWRCRDHLSGGGEGGRAQVLSPRP